MNTKKIKESFSAMTTPLIADASVRLGMQLRLAPPGIAPLIPSQRLAGRALPARHYGSVDIFLEAMEHAGSGDILVIDNGGRLDEGCIGDLTALEAQAAGLSGMIVWGCHRDTAELVQIGFPVFSYGACAAGPTRLDQRQQGALTTARFGSWEVSRDDIVFADADGVIFVQSARLEEALATAGTIWQTERRQAESIKAGKMLRDQLHFKDYLTKRDADPAYTFRKHLRALGGAIEE